MFAPPPALPLSKAEIEAQKTRLLYGIRKPAESAGRLPSQQSDKISPKSRHSQTSDNQSPSSLMRKLATFGRDKIRAARKSTDISGPLPSAPPSASLPPIPKTSQPTSAANVLEKETPARVDSCVSSPPSKLISPKSAYPDCNGAPKRPPRPVGGLLFDSRFTSQSNASLSQPRGSNASPQALHAGFRAESNVRARKRPIDQLEGHLSPRRPKHYQSDEPSDLAPVAHDTHHAINIPDQIDGDSPSSILHTPLELKKSVNTGQGPAVERKRLGLMPILERSTAQSAIIARRNQASVEQSQPSPQRTQIHLRGGSILTVTPPELDPWHRTTYLQGPIRLSKPNALPRKNSVATLDAFQDAVDKVFQDGESVTKRRSEMAAADEICLFFMGFTLGECRYDADSLAIEGAAYSDESDEDLSFQCMGREFETPPDSPNAWRSSKPVTVTMPALPPVENEETLRAKGLDWLARQRQRSGQTSYLPMVPEPEDSMLEVVLAASASEDPKSNVVVWEDVEETNAAAPWIRSLSGHKAAVLRRNSQ